MTRRSGMASGVIVEVEAYIGESDPACHAAPGPTTRNAPLYGPPGIAYVYLNYGIHYLVNAVTEAEGWPAAVLIRALEPREGDRVDAPAPSRRARNVRPTSDVDDLCRGPGNLTKALGIDLRQNLLDLTGSALRIEDRKEPTAADRVEPPHRDQRRGRARVARLGRRQSRRVGAAPPVRHIVSAMRRFVAFLIALLSFAPVASAQTGGPTVTILHFNDVYEITPIEAGKAGGLARVATLRARLKARFPHLITTLGGDYLSPSALGTARVEGERLAGRQMVAVLNVLGLDWAVLGNHEFDLPEAAFRARLAESKFGIVASNVTDAAGAPFPGTVPHAVVPIRTPSGTIRVGLIGITIDANHQPWVRYARPRRSGAIGGRGAQGTSRRDRRSHTPDAPGRPRARRAGPGN